jgi:SAM-dependent methyltransferase
VSKKSFGDTWREQPAPFWDGMWAKHEGSPMTERIIELVSNHGRRVVEIGCGCGHIIREVIARGWTGAYLGYDISAVAVDKTRAVVSDLDDSYAVNADFLVDIEPALGFGADIVFARGVLQHQSHWAPMVVAALRVAPLVVMGIGYTTTGPRHEGGWKAAGHYDVHVSLPLLRYEAEAMGIRLELSPMPNDKRPEYKEALALFRRLPNPILQPA